MKKTFALAVTAAFMMCGNASAGVVINEVIGSTTGGDTEFIELFNNCTTPIDISGWVIEEVESDPGASNGTIEDSWTIPAGFTLGPSGQASLLYTSPSPRDATLSRMPSSA